MADFKIGDMVSLKSGNKGLIMTIDQFNTYGGRKRATCKWYNEKEGKFEKENFDCDALILTNEAK